MSARRTGIKAKSLPVPPPPKSRSQKRTAPKAAGTARAKPPAWCKPGPITLTHDATVDDAIWTIAGACRDHWQANLAAALAGEHPEGIHQVRVGLRRFRVFLTLFMDRLPADQLAWLKAETKVLGDALGQARDLDVFLTELVGPLTAKATDDSNVAVLLRGARDARESAQENAVTALTSPRYRRFMTRLNTWLSGRGWRNEAHKHQESAHAFARHTLNHRLAKVVDRAKSVDDMSAHKLHRLRIAVKKLRYGFEFFHDLLPHKRAPKAAHVLKDLQDALGHVNDLEVAQRTITMLSERARDNAARLAIARGGRKLTAAFSNAAKQARPQATRAAHRLRDQKPL